MLQSLRFVSVLGSVLISLSPAYGQSVPDQESPELVVTGKEIDDATAVRRTVQQLAEPIDGQLARFRQPVCPHVEGMSAPYAQMVVERIRDVAREAGARVGDTGCTPNLYFVVVDDGRRFAEELYRQYPDAFANVDAETVERITQQSGVARSWSITLQRDAAGLGLESNRRNTGPEISFASSSGVSGSFRSDTPIVRAYEASILSPSVQQSIERTYVVIDGKAALGKGLMQLADYVAMRGLAMTRPESLSGDADSILTLFNPGVGVRNGGLTDFDRAYLSGLYHGSAVRTGTSQRHAIVRQILRDEDELAK